jgi:hypothetical protein
MTGQPKAIRRPMLQLYKKATTLICAPTGFMVRFRPMKSFAQSMNLLTSGGQHLAPVSMICSVILQNQ